MSKITSSRGYVFTINNPQNTKEELLEELKDKYSSSKYIAVSKEKGKNGTEHLQGYIEFSNPVPFDRLKKTLPTAHIEKRKGSPQQARDYVFKEGNYADKADTIVEPAIEDGNVPKGQGKRNDLTEIAELLEQGSTPKDIRISYPTHYLRYRQHIHTMHQEIQEEKYKSVIRDLEIYYVWGESRTGKTGGIYDYYGMEDVYRVNDYQNPFDSYAGQDIIILEEYHSNLPMSYLLQLLEGYPLRLTARYMDKIACFTKVFIVSNKTISEQYPNIQQESRATFQAFKNRINQSIHVKEFGDLQRSLKFIENPHIDNWDSRISIREPKSI